MKLVHGRDKTKPPWLVVLFYFIFYYYCCYSFLCSGRRGYKTNGKKKRKKKEKKTRPLRVPLGLTLPPLRRGCRHPLLSFCSCFVFFPPTHLGWVVRGFRPTVCLFIIYFYAAKGALCVVRVYGGVREFMLIYVNYRPRCAF